MDTKEKIISGNTYLGIELGSTRIKACLIDDTFTPIASGSHQWENNLEDGYWTYSLESIHKGVAACYKSLKEDVLSKFGVVLENTGAVGVSAMMHGYLAFDKYDNLLVPFRTWRNTTTEMAANELTQLFGFNIPQRWSIAHLYQAMLNKEEHVEKISYITTLAGYIHYRLTGKHEVGIGDASGIFPIKHNEYNREMLEKFDSLVKKCGYSWDIKEVLPKIRLAGERGAFLTAGGAKFLDPEGNLISGIPVCPPEGDAGTGMVATNSVLARTGNISAGTSIFSMLVLDDDLKGVYPEIDMVTTPDGKPVAMVHCNNCCCELDAWVNIFYEFADLSGKPVDKPEIYEMLYKNALSGDTAGLCSYNFLSGEPVAGVTNGRPMYFRLPDAKMNLSSFIKSLLYSSFATLAMGMELLFEKEKVSADKFFGHGGLFKVEGVAQQLLSDALKTDISVMETTGEGGAWGMAILASYMKENSEKSLGDFLSDNVFSGIKTRNVSFRQKFSEEFRSYLELYRKGLDAQRKLGEVK